MQFNTMPGTGGLAQIKEILMEKEGYDGIILTDAGSVEVFCAIQSCD